MPKTILTFQHSGQKGSIQRQRTALIALQENYAVVKHSDGESRYFVDLYADSHLELAVAQREAVQLLVASGYTIL